MKYLFFLLCLCSSTAYAQSSEFSAGLHYSWLTLAGGNASTNLVSAAGFGGRVSFAPAFLHHHLRITASFTSFPRDRGYTPPISAAGLEVSGVLNPNASIQPYAGVGIGRIQFSPETNEFPPCIPDNGCIDEGAANFESDTYATVRPFLGIAVPLTAALSIAGEFRMHIREETGFNGSGYAPELAASLSYGFGPRR